MYRPLCGDVLSPDIFSFLSLLLSISVPLSLLLQRVGLSVLPHAHRSVPLWTDTEITGDVIALLHSHGGLTFLNTLVALLDLLKLRTHLFLIQIAWIQIDIFFHPSIQIVIFCVLPLLSGFICHFKAPEIILYTHLRAFFVLFLIKVFSGVITKSVKCFL